MTLSAVVYDALPYTCTAMPYAHPHRLATVATVFGMKPPPVTTSRILELGCGTGNHIIASAYTLPQAQCVGIDLSTARIAQGQHLIEALGLTNITLKPLNILEVDEHFGQFDYIIAHGIYTWVAKTVQNKILAICQHHLAPQGVAYISYYTQPGWYIQGVIRDLMRYHLRDMHSAPLSQLFTTLTVISGQGQDAYSRFLHQTLTELQTLPAEYLFQQLLAQENQPLYFYEFMERAQAQQLAYLGDAFLATQFPDNPDTSADLTALSHNMLAQEQYLDILRQRQFRHSLLCHQDIALSRTLSPQLMKHFYVAFNGNWQPDTDSVICQAVLDDLAQQWPRALSLSQLRQHSEQDEAQLSTLLLKGYLKGVVECFTEPPHCVTTISTTPEASALARWQAQQSGQALTNQRCEWLNSVPEFSRWLLFYLDGQHDRQALLKLIQESKFKEKFKLNGLSTVEEILDNTLQQLAHAALLIA